MKRSWFGMILLLVLLITCAGASGYISRLHAPMAETAMEAAEFALEGDWGNAMSLVGRIRTQWEDRWGMVAAFADHGPMEKINSLFAQLEVYAAAGDRVSYASVCAALSAAMDAMADGGSFTWWNFL